MKEEQPSLKKILQPYLIISVAGLLAFAPVSFMLKALKNDIIALEYPINHFISQSIHNGEIPYWFNTWGMGFPLQSNLTWGIFSTPQILFSSLFNYNIYTLHIEFMFFVLLAGWGMFYLLQKHILKDQKLSQLFAICYMLSGFVVGSTQWLLYITAAAFIPLVISCLLSLLHTPSLRNSIQFAIVYTLMFTSVYAAFNIITSYSLIVFVLIWFLFFEKEKNKRPSRIKYLGVAAFFTLLFCLPCVYFTTEVLQHIGRGSSIASDTGFFNSNYLHPASLSNLLLPFSSVKMGFLNTEGTMLDSYMGLLIILLLPLSIWRVIKEKNKSSIFILFTAVLFLLISFGEMTPIRNLLNIFPGFAYFRNPAIFRLYFIIAIIIFTANTFRYKNFTELFIKAPESKAIYRTAYLLLAVSLFVGALHINALQNISFSNLTIFIKNITYHNSLFISAIIQIFFLIAILVLLKIKRTALLNLVLIFDLIINTLICTPFFSVSSSSIAEVSAILHPTNGFPVQSIKPADVAVSYIDNKGNTWNNVNIFRKEISTRDSYRGPLTLNNFYSDSSAAIAKEVKTENSILLIESDSTKNTINLLVQRPTFIKALVYSQDSSVLTVQQNYYKGWRSFYNKKEVEIIADNRPGMSIIIPKGEGVVEFKYERKSVWLAAFALHLIVVIFLVWKAVNWIRKFVTKSPSPS
ncbi:hypothetical protein CAP36_13060 [Chitinophagaceae bacterium IBVUCB2]|nr:hypothetical protein CAP36_13060 [Chitinophagaceae bacterium IBVUCB2]